MKRYIVTVASVQTWYYVYEVDAEDEDQAKQLGYEAHGKGNESIDNWVDTEKFYPKNVQEVNT